MEITDRKIEAYATGLSEKETPDMENIRRNTYLNHLMPHMLSGPLQGALLRMISLMIRPAKILEIGTFTGYSALCLCEGLAPGGKLTTIEVNDESEEGLRKTFSEAGKQEQIELLIGQALELLPALPNHFDLIFVDADKKNYLNYFEACMPKLKPGGFLLFDNVLWYGKILQNEDEMDRDTSVIHSLNKRVAEHPNLTKVLIPLRDGMMLARKNS